MRFCGWAPVPTGLVSLLEEIPQSLFSLLVRSQRSTQQVGSCLEAKRRSLEMKPPLPSPWFWTSQPPKQRNKLLLLNPQSMVSCYGSPGWLEQNTLTFRKWGKSRNHESCREKRGKRASEKVVQLLAAGTSLGLLIRWLPFAIYIGD